VGLHGWCAAAFAFLLPVQFALGGDVRFAPSDLFIGGFVVLRLPRMRLGRAAWSGWQLALCATFLVGLAVAALDADQLTSFAILQKAGGVATLLVSFACIVDFCLDDARRLAWLCRSFLLGVLCNVILALSALYLEQAGIAHFSNINLDGARLSGLLIDPNAFGGLLVVAIALHLTTRACGHALVDGTMGLLLTALLPVALVLTYSRSAWIGMVLAAATGVVFVGVRLGVALGKLLAALGLVALLALNVVLPNADALINRQEQVDERVSILSDAFGEFESRPFLGIGLGVFQERHDVLVHNTSMWFLTEFGPLGLLTLLAMLMAFWSKGVIALRTLDDPYRLLAVGLLAGSIGMYGVSMGIEALYQRHWWFTFAGLGLLYSYAMDDRNEQEATA
jgi:hypothetical protein